MYPCIYFVHQLCYGSFQHDFDIFTCNSYRNRVHGTSVGTDGVWTGFRWCHSTCMLTCRPPAPMDHNGLLTYSAKAARDCTFHQWRFHMERKMLCLMSCLIQFTERRSKGVCISYYDYLLLRKGKWSSKHWSLKGWEKLAGISMGLRGRIK